MRIIFERSGGFAGIKLSAAFDLDSLPKDQADEIRSAVNKVDFSRLSEQMLPPTPMPDQLEYVITIETDEWQHKIVTSDTTAPAELQPLLRTLTRFARKEAK
jgi:hypothetical protein